MALKGHAFLGNFAKRRQAHHLIAAAVGQDRPVPSRKMVQAAKAGNPLCPGAQHQVIGVAQNNVGTGGAHFCRAHRLYRRSGANGHKGRRADFAAQHLDATGARFAVSCADFKIESLCHQKGHSWQRD